MRGVSYDLAVREGDRPANDFAACARVGELYEHYVGVGSVPPTDRIAAYVAALLDRYPDLGLDDDEHAKDASPWSTLRLLGAASGPLAYVPMVLSRAEQVSGWVVELAARHRHGFVPGSWTHRPRTWKVLTTVV